MCEGRGGGRGVGVGAVVATLGALSQALTTLRFGGRVSHWLGVY